MKFGVVFPQTEFNGDAGAVREFTQAVEAIGYTHVVAYDHVLGVNPERTGGWKGVYTYKDSFLEPFVLFSYMAGISTKLGFMPGIIILPQRQTALAAKQAATLDVLCQGRLRLGVGLGWNAVEYAALNEDFHTRGRRLEEQVEVLRLLWTEPLVTFKGRWTTIPDAGINPLPVQRPIPIWLGGTSPQALQRAARIGDGYLPNFRSIDDARKGMDVIRRALDAAGRKLENFGVEPLIAYGDGNPETWRHSIQAWQAIGATQFSFNTLGAGFRTPDAHLNAIKKFAAAVDFTPA